MALAAMLWACGATCETGEVCDRACPTGGRALCAAHGLCACVAAPDAGPGGPESPGGASTGDGDDDGADAGPASPAACRPPTPGSLVINELMLDGEPTEDAEFVELVNLGAEPVALAGLVLTSNRGADQVRRVEFGGGCLPAGAALAMFPDRAAWIESSPSPWPIVAELRSFGFANGGDFDFRLSLGDVVIDRVEGSGDQIRPGVSQNRAPDLLGPALDAHDAVDPAGAPASPARCPGGGRYEDGCPAPPDDDPLEPRDAGLFEPRDVGSLDPGEILDGGVERPVFDCPPPAPGDLRINEVLIDGVVPRTEADEFVELLNTTAEPRRLAGVALAIESGGALDPRVVFTDGCLPPFGALVLHPRPEDWRYLPEPDPPPIVADARLVLGNEAAAPLALIDAEGGLIDRFDPADAPIVEGVSLNRSPEPTGARVVTHDRLAAATASPGTCAGGAPFGEGGCPGSVEARCPPPDAEALVINEVLVDGEAENDADEFVELVNRGAAPVALDGLSLWSSRSDGVLVERAAFARGCLPPGALAIFASRADWRGEGADAPLEARVDRLALPNEAPLVVELRGPDGALGRVELPGRFAGPGVSAVRAVEADPAAEMVRHDEVADAPRSPGVRSDGAAFRAPSRGTGP